MRAKLMSLQVLAVHAHACMQFSRASSRLAVHPQPKVQACLAARAQLQRVLKAHIGGPGPWAVLHACTKRLRSQLVV